jgi:hypothetical protein
VVLQSNTVLIAVLGSLLIHQATQNPLNPISHRCNSKSIYRTRKFVKLQVHLNMLEMLLWIFCCNKSSRVISAGQLASFVYIEMNKRWQERSVKVCRFHRETWACHKMIIRWHTRADGRGPDGCGLNAYMNMCANHQTVLLHTTSISILEVLCTIKVLSTHTRYAVRLSCFWTEIFSPLRDILRVCR